MAGLCAIVYLGNYQIYRMSIVQYISGGCGSLFYLYVCCFSERDPSGEVLAFGGACLAQALSIV
jgi:hypothetical protein